MANRKLPMSLCARAVALWLAACALAARAQAVRLQCTHPNCKWLETDGIYEHYEINGENSNYIGIEKGKYFTMTCSSLVPLDDPARPRFPLNEKFDIVFLHYCAPPANTSYAAALKELNVLATKELDVWIPAGAHISAASLAGLENLRELYLGFVDVTPPELEPGALDALDGLPILTLQRVRADRVPRVTGTLYLKNVTILPKGAFDVNALEIEDSQLRSINESAPLLKVLKLFFMSSLVSLTLRNTSDELELYELVTSCPVLEVLELRHPRAYWISVDLLQNASSLKTFIYTHSIITELPFGLFAHSPHLQVIDISHNQLDSLPSNVFSGLTELHELRLEGNRLTASAFRDIAPLAALTVLNLSENPLMDICSEDLSHLKSLQELSLAHTNASRVCSAWLRELGSLRFLDLRGNEVQSVYCADLRANSSDATITVIDLTDNKLEQFNCLSDSSIRPDNDMQFREIQLITETPEICDCNCSYVSCLAPVYTSPASTTPETTTSTTPTNTLPVATTPVATTKVAIAPVSSTSAETTTDETTSSSVASVLEAALPNLASPITPKVWSLVGGSLAALGLVLASLAGVRYYRRKASGLTTAGNGHPAVAWKKGQLLDNCSADGENTE